LGGGRTGGGAFGGGTCGLASGEGDRQGDRRSRQQFADEAHRATSADPAERNKALTLMKG
jgi:hypothetical protein